MGKIRLVGLDLDGTLLDDSKKISAPTMEALEEAARQGVYLVPVTGRPHLGIPTLVRNLPFVRYIISCNGACIRDEKNGALLRERLIPAEESRALVCLLQEKRVPFEVLFEGVGYAESWVYEQLIAKNPHNAFLPRYVKETRRTIPDMRAFVEEGRGLEELFVLAGSRDSVEEILHELHHFPNLHIVHPGPGMLELTAAGVDKGEALLALATQLGIDRSETMAIGDSGNDLTMLRAAGFSVAMGNAAPEVKKLSDVVTETNENHGVAMALSRYVLA